MSPNRATSLAPFINGFAIIFLTIFLHPCDATPRPPGGDRFAESESNTLKQEDEKDSSQIDWEALQTEFKLKPFGSIFSMKGFGLEAANNPEAAKTFEDFNQKWESAVMSLGYTKSEARRLLAGRLAQDLAVSQAEAKKTDWKFLRGKYQLVDITRIRFSRFKTVDPNAQPWIDAVMSLGHDRANSLKIIEMRKQQVQMEALNLNTITPPKFKLAEKIKSPGFFKEDLGSISTGTLASITNQQAKSLFLIEPTSWLSFQFGSLTSITDSQAKIFGQLYGTMLTLDGLTSLTDSQAASLSQFGGKLVGKRLSLNSLTSLTDSQAESLAKFSGVLSLNGLKVLTNSQARSFGAYKGIVGNQSETGKPSRINLNGLASITDEQAISLGKINELFLNGLTSITPKQLKSLTNNGFNLVGQRYARIGSGSDLGLNGLTTLSDSQAQSLRGSVSRSSVQLDGLTSITDRQAESLGKMKLTRNGNLALNGIASLHDTQAASLAAIPALSLNGLTAITDAQAKTLGSLGGDYRTPAVRPGPLASLMTPPNFSLSISGVKSITDQQAEYLAEGLTDLDLRGLKTLTQRQAKTLSRIKNVYVAYDFQGLIDEFEKADQLKK